MTTQATEAIDIESSGLTSSLPIQPRNILESSIQGNTSNNDTTQSKEILYIASVVGASIAMLGTLLTMLSYIGYRRFSVKRTHIVMVNLCVCLLVYFISYTISNRYRQFPHNDFDDLHLCIAGAFLCHLSVLCSWFWITSYWFLLLVMFQRPLGGHISHFFLKAAFPSYVFPILAAGSCIAVAAVNNEIYEKKHPYFSKRCFVDNTYLYVGLILPFVLGFFPIFGIFVFVLKGLSRTSPSVREQRNRSRVKGHLIKLSVITLFIAIVMLSTVIVPASTDEAGRTTRLIAVICFTVGSISLGLLLMFLFCINQKEIRHHWMAVLTGKSSGLHHRSMSLGKVESIAIYGSRKSSSGHSRQPMLAVDPPEEPERKSSTIRIVPKDDTDMSTLGLIQIPGTNPSHEPVKSELNKPKDSDNTGNGKSVKDVAANNKENLEQSQILNQEGESKKSRNASTSSTGSKSKHPLAKRLKSTGNVISSKKDRNKEAKRRSFSTSQIAAENDMKFSVAKRKSALSTDSTQMTNFE